MNSSKYDVNRSIDLDLHIQSLWSSGRTNSYKVKYLWMRANPIILWGIKYKSLTIFNRLTLSLFSSAFFSKSYLMFQFFNFENLQPSRYANFLVRKNRLVWFTVIMVYFDIVNLDSFFIRLTKVVSFEWKCHINGIVPILLLEKKFLFHKILFSSTVYVPDSHNVRVYDFF